MGKMNTSISQNDLTGDCILLTPFLHQIGGHNIVLRYDDATICKLLNSREKFFYETIPKDLYEYLPEYRGTIEVQMKEDEQGLKRFFTQCTNTDNISQVGIRLKRVKCENSNTQNENHTENVKSVLDKTISQLQSNCLNRIHSTNETVMNFILLENMVAKYKYPCILDIKMGTQQHGDDASEQKKNKQTLKCQISTSSKIGSRLCGMQVYQINTHEYICFDKYMGRQLTVDGFKRNLLQFLNNGLKFRVDVIEPIIEKLTNLHQILKTKHSYRFYGSSLLVLYDGYEAPMQSSESPHNVDVRMIDFAHSTHNGYIHDAKMHIGPDHGYLFGLDNLVKIFQEIKNDCIQLTINANDNEPDSSHSESSCCLANRINLSHICLNQTLLPPPDPSPSATNNNQNLFSK